MTTIIDTLRQNVAFYPDKRFCRFIADRASTDLTYSDLWRHAHGFAHALQAKGVNTGDIVIIMIRHRIELYASFIGTIIHGAIPSFMPCPNVKQRAEIFWPSHRKLFDRIKPGGFITEADLIAPISKIVAAGTPILDVASAPHDGTERTVPGDANSIAFLQHSSGTTGTKKGVMLSHRAVLEQVRSYARTIAFDRDSHIASWLPLYHDMGLIACLFTPLICGASVTHMDALEWTSNPLSLLDIIEIDRATHSWIPNFAFNHIAISRRRAKNKSWSLGSLQMVINCSEPCKAESMEAFVAAFADCGIQAKTPQICYAMAENVFAVTQTDPSTAIKYLSASRSALQDHVYSPAEGAEAKRIPSCGKVIPNVEIRIVDADGQALQDGRIGEICIRGTCLFDGYYLLPDSTADKLKGDWYHSGDLGFLHEGELYVTGRVDDLIIVRGRNFYAHDIEAIISKLPSIKSGRVVAFSVENSATGTQDVICLAEVDDPNVDPIALRRLAKSEVETQSGLVLTKFQLHPIGTLVKTTSGKISREMNMKLFVEKQFVTEGGHG